MGELAGINPARHCLSLGATAAFMLALGPASMTRAQPDFVELLDPALSRWTVVDAEPGTFTWDADVLRITGPEGWLRSDERYSDFDLRVEFRFLTDAADSGVFFRATGAEPFLRGWPNEAYQLQMRNPAGESPFPPLGGLFRHGMPEAETQFDEAGARAVTRPAGEWQVLEISVNGEHVSAAINGRSVLDAEGIGNETGYIGLQGETPSLEFRSVRIRPRD